VLLASILAFDFEPSGSSERLLPSAAYSLGVDENAGDPGLDDDLHPVESRVVVYCSVVRMRLDVALSDDLCATAERCYPFDARGPPVAA